MRIQSASQAAGKSLFTGSFRLGPTTPAHAYADEYD
jgi:hypothetical protein